MKRLALAAATGLSLFAHTAIAADLGVRLPLPGVAPPVALYNWTGFYFGGHAGYIWGRADHLDVDGYNSVGDTFSYTPSGFLGGGHTGFNWQAGWLVFGAEIDGGYMGLTGSAQYPPYVGVRTVNDSRAITDDGWYAAATGRLGVAWNNLLLYGKGGWVWTSMRSRFIDSDPIGTTLVTGTSTGNRDGWTAGGGVEYGFTPNWTGRIEYAHYDFGTARHTATSAGGGLFRFDHRLTADSVVVGVTYKWGPVPVPIAARY